VQKRTKFLTILAGTVLLGGVAVKLFQAPIGMAAYERALSTRVGRDATAALPDGLHVALCGTGSPLPNPDRAGPCNVVIAGKHIFIVDVGEGSARNIARMGLPIGRAEAVFLTHFHSDHIDGLGPVMLQRWIGLPSHAPLPIHGPSGVEAIVAGFNAAYATDNGYRTSHHGPTIAPPSGAGAAAVPFALPQLGQGDSIVAYEADGLKVTAFRVNHGPVSPAVGYRFDYKGRSIVISGDTAKSPTLVRAANGADLLVHEALQPRLVALMTAALEAKHIRNTAQITRDIVNYHTTPEQAADSAREAGVKQLVLSHIVPPLPSKFFYPAFLGDAAKHFDGPITVGEDGMMFSLTAGGKSIENKTLF
jgi:ribonuclease Z